MKKIILLLSVVLFIATACHLNHDIEITDLNAANEDVIQLADKYLKAWNAKDMNTLMAITADKGMYFGSDPSEIMDKTSMATMFAQVFADTTANYSYTIDLREIKLAKDGESALVVEYLNMPWAAKLQLRQTFHCVQSAQSWKIDFIAWGFIAKNEDVEKLNEVLE